MAHASVWHQAVPKVRNGPEIRPFWILTDYLSSIPAQRSTPAAQNIRTLATIPRALKTQLPLLCLLPRPIELEPTSSGITIRQADTDLSPVLSSDRMCAPIDGLDRLHPEARIQTASSYLHYAVVVAEVAAAVAVVRSTTSGSISPRCGRSRRRSRSRNRCISRSRSSKSSSNSS